MDPVVAKEAPYTELSFGRIREIHDQVYFGRWRGPSPTDDDLRQAQEAGVSHLLTKPFSSAQLLDEVTAFTSLRR